MITNTGYALDRLMAFAPWQQNGEPFNLAQLVCGSEGTLGVVLEATVKLTPTPEISVVLGAHFDSITNALQAVAVAVAHNAAAVELLDKYLLNLTAQNKEQQRNRFWIDDRANAVLLIEFSGKQDRNVLLERVQRLVSELKQDGLGFHFPVLENADAERAWAVRRAALGLLMGMRSEKKAVSFIEDSAVPVTGLADFVHDVQKLMTTFNTDCVYYGSVSMGLIHLRPLLNLHTEAGRQRLSKIGSAVADLLVRYGGTMSAKHGDGRVRSAFIERFVGTELMEDFRRIKLAFDPQGLLNPGKIVAPLPMDDDLRYQLGQGKALITGFRWPRNGGLLAAIEQCNGAGVCRRLAGQGVMCPSYRATKEEKHSTRGRANVLRQVLQHQQLQDLIAIHQVLEVLDLCLACKACHSECPANVDMARIKSECLYQLNKHRPLPLSARVVSALPAFSRWGSRAPVLANALTKLPIGKRLLGFDARRRLPSLARPPFSKWHKRRSGITHNDHSNATVVILNDLFTEYYDSACGRAAVEVLEQLGFTSRITTHVSALRPLISQGLLAQAKSELFHAIDELYEYATQGLWIIGLEPSELLTYRDEAQAFDVSDDVRDKIQMVAQQSVLFEEFLLQCESSRLQRLQFVDKPLVIGVHTHCHQKALSRTEVCAQALNLIPQAKVHHLDSGCCGMAGTFGYEKNHYEVSKTIAEIELFPHVRQLPDDAVIVATGTSCRQQIWDLLGCRAYHSAEILRRNLRF
jgi:Fe-S oxidoreductase